MTTVAWDGRMLAADRMAQAGWAYPVTKIFSTRYKGSDAFLAISGDLEEGIAVKEWIDDGMHSCDKPSVNKDSFAALLLTKDGVFRMESRLVLWPVEAPHALGSGRDFAVMAMHLGKSADEAVVLAGEFDCNTGMGVSTAKL